MENILVSVVIPSCGRDVPLLERAIQSARNQTHQPMEVLLADDNAADDPLCYAIKAYCERFENVIYVRTKGRQGACAARNLGFEHSHGAYVGFLDDDDEWMPEKVEVSLPLFKPGVGMVGTRGYQVTEGIGGATAEAPYMEKDWTPEPSFLDLLRNDTVGTTTLAIVERNCFLDVGGFQTQLPARQDYEMWLRIRKKYRIVLSEQFLFRHYIHQGEQISKSHQKSLDGLRFIYNEFEADYKKDARAYAYIWSLMLSRYRALGQKSETRKCLFKILRVRPRYLGRYIADTTKSERLRAFLKARMRG